METCGLVIHGDDIPVSFDRFRDRVMFPIPDSRGRIIAFGGRALTSDALAKYLNSPETELFHKGNVLYNYVRARKALQKDGTVIAVEGYMDVIALAQAGFENVVAPLGTALTENQLELIWRMAGEPVLCFDGDQAGLKAAWRAADMALPLIQPGRTLRFALLPEGKDPDDLVKADGPDAFRAVLAEARPLADLLWMRETSGGVFDTPERRADLEKTLRELTSRIRDESVRYHYQQEMRDRVHAFFGAQRGRAVRQATDRTGRARQTQQRGAGRPMGTGWRGCGASPITESLGPLGHGQARGQVMPLREAAIVVALVNHPQLVDENFDKIESLDLGHSELEALHSAFDRCACAWTSRRPRHDGRGDPQRAIRRQAPEASSIARDSRGARGSGLLRNQTSRAFSRLSNPPPSRRWSFSSGAVPLVRERRCGGSMRKRRTPGTRFA